MSDTRLADIYGFLSDSKWGDPFLTPTGLKIPTGIQEALQFGEFLYYLNPRYARAASRVAAHFIQDVQFEEGGASEESKKHRKLLYDTLNIRAHMQQAGMDLAAYGNSFWRMFYPFDRFVTLVSGGKFREINLAQFSESDVRFDLGRMMYEVPVGPNRSKRWLPFVDRPNPDPGRLRLMHMDPKRIILRYHQISGRTDVLWKFPETFVSDIKSGSAFHVNDTPREMLEAVRDNAYFLYNPDEVTHVKTPTLSGMNDGAWGMPDTIANYRLLRQLQMYRRIDEAIAMDYLIPFRVFSPAILQGQHQSADLHLGEDSKRFIREMIRQHRLDPTKIFGSPFPMQMTEFGSSGKNLVPKDIIELQTRELLEAVGFPVELASGSLQLQAVPTAIRMFEAAFEYIYNGFNALVTWTSRKALDFQRLPLEELSLKRPSMANDLEERSVFLQLAAGGEISRGTAFRPFGIVDPVAEAVARTKEDQKIEEERAREGNKARRRAESGSLAILAGAPGAGPGAPMAPAGGPGPVPAGDLSPTELEQHGQQEAERLLQIQANGDRAKELRQIKATNPNLHAVIMQKMDEMRGQAASQGRAQVGQMVGGGG